MNVYRWEGSYGELHIVAVAETADAAREAARQELVRYFSTCGVPEEWHAMLEAEPTIYTPPFAETFNLRE